MTTTEEHLGRFYIELQAWIDGGCGEHGIFRPHQPICDQLLDWEFSKRNFGLRHIVTDQFQAAGLNSYRPFDTGLGMDRAIRERTLYTNPARLAWIKEHAEAAKAAGLAVAS